MSDANKSLYLASVSSADVMGSTKFNFADILNKEIVDNQIEEAKYEDEFTPLRR